MSTTWARLGDMAKFGSADCDFATHANKPLPWLASVVRGENLLGSRPVASRRPYGARPGKRLAIEGGLEFRWEY
ncbi:MAG: hypothetical protein IV100_07765 [Myxococcales bacterium]|nr:hypothetical protein [Myxococcales bacterium]